MQVPASSLTEKEQLLRQIQEATKQQNKLIIGRVRTEQAKRAPAPGLEDVFPLGRQPLLQYHCGALSLP